MTGDSAAAAGEVTGHSPELYGPALPCEKIPGSTPCNDVAVFENLLCAVGSGAMTVYDITRPKNPQPLGKISGLGSSRQIEIVRNIAYITARQDGLFVVDLQNPAAPQLLCHYDSIELATGIKIEGNTAYITNRQYGVEFVDISDPRQPKFLGYIKTGEAQSVDAVNGLLYAGDWGTRELTVIDARNPRNPRRLGSAPLGGLGDGTYVRNQICYAATGYLHYAKFPAEKQGRGHGLDIFSVADPAHPKQLSRFDLPRLCNPPPDFWSVEVAGTTAFVADTYNGLFVLDVGDPRHPRPLGHCQLPVAGRQNLPDAVGGLALAEGVIYAAGAHGGLYVVEAAGLAHRPEPDRQAPRLAEAPPPDADLPSETAARFEIYKPGTQIHAATIVDDTAWVAAGAGGLHVLSLSEGVKLKTVYPSEGFVFDVKICGNRLHLAEGLAGFSSWEISASGDLRKIGAYRETGQSIKQIVVPAPGRYALLKSGVNTLQILDLNDPAKPAKVLEDRHGGILYGREIAEGLLSDRYAACMWHGSGIYWFDLYGAEHPQALAEPTFAKQVNFTHGLAFYRNQILLVAGGGYYMAEREEKRPLQELQKHSVPELGICGKAVIQGSKVCVTNRPDGSVALIDLADPQRPRLLKRFSLPGQPDLACFYRDRLVVPVGYAGLWIER